MAVAQLPFDLDEGKLTPPAIRTSSVEKTDVIAKLVTSAVPFATVIAPAGYGKTTLLSRWATTDPRPFAWLSLDERDDDIVVFLSDIAAAIDRVAGIPPAVFEALSRRGASMWSRVGYLGNALAGLKRPLVIALDDLHAVRNQSCLDALAALFAYVPPRSQIVFTSRNAPALPIARWRASGLVCEIGAPDLRLDHREADLLLRGAEIALDESEVADLNDRIEGWPAGLYLAALSLRAGAPDTRRVARFAGDDRFVADYFRLEVLSRLPEHDARFLVRTSVLDRLNGSLCDAVLETTGSAETLEALARSNGFVVPLDHRGESYRYHHLFRQLLRDELDRGEPLVAQRLNRRAMAWHLANDDPESAMRYGHAAGETEVVAGLVDRLGLATYYDGRIETLEEWISWFGVDDLARFPALAVYGGWVKALTGLATEAERYVSLAAGATSIIPLSDGSPSIRPWTATLRATMMPDGVEQARLDADLALRELPHDSGWRPSAMTMRGIAHALLGSAELAKADLEAVIPMARATGGVDELFIAQAELAVLHAKRGEWVTAARYAEQARAVVQESGLDDYSVSGIVHVTSARIALHERRTLEARAAMARANRLRPMLSHAIPWLAVQVGVGLTRAHLALGEADAARTILAETLEIMKVRPDLGSLVDEANEVGERIAAKSSRAGALEVNLTAAELRLLPYLATYLTFPEIAIRLFITSHTVRSEAKAIYRKLDASSRAEAMDRAVDAGLLEPTFPHRETVAL